VAACLARCAALAGGDAKLSEEMRKEKAEAYGKQAVEWLRRAVADGFKDVKQLKDGEAFRPLRTREDFQRLLSDLETRLRAAAVTPLPATHMVITRPSTLWMRR
jgi:hypothetical protein